VRRTVVLSGLIYVAAIVAANYMITHGPGTPTPFGTYTLPVGFGLVAPAGTYMAALAFPARDVLQRSGGRLVGIAAILVGAGVSCFVSSPTIAVASGVTFLVSETIDFAIFTPMQRRHFGAAVVTAGLFAALVDSALFLHLAGLPMSGLAGLVVGKVWVILIAGPAAFGLRKVVPAR
jgi:uncharacterized PurR-regulated membrane protein YhhQ (DUF165 family)